MKTVIEMAQEAGFNKNELAYLGDNFLRLAALVAAQEREACAKVCEEKYEYYGPCPMAEAIRARGTT